MIGWIALSCNAIVGEARRRRIVFNTVFAAFFGAKGARSCLAWGIDPRNPIVPRISTCREHKSMCPKAPISARAYANVRMLE
jgi:hypothetical protein